MSATPPGSRPGASRVALLGIVGLVLLGAVALLSHGGAQGTLRTVLAFAAVLVIPSWLLGRLVDDEGDAIFRSVLGVVLTLSVCVLGGFVAFELGLRVELAVAVVPLLVVVALATVLGVMGPPAPRARLAPLLVAIALGVVALAGAWGTHLALPSVPVEPAFSIEAATATASPHGVIVAVTVSRVHTTSPSVLVVSVDHRLVATAVVQGQSRLRITAALPPDTTKCPSVVSITAPNGAFLTPPVVCAGW